MSTAVTPAPNLSPALNGPVPRRKVVVMLSGTIDPKPLEEALARQGMEPLYLDESPVTGSFDDVLAERLAGATAIIAVYHHGPSVRGVYALGYARAIGKQAAVISLSFKASDEPLRKAWPEDIALFYGPLTNTENLDLLVSNCKHPVRPPSKIVRPHGPFLASHTADSLITRVNVGLDDRAALDVITEALAGLDLKPVVNEAAQLVAVWVHGLSPWLSNPVLIRVAGNVHSAEDLKSLLNKLGEVQVARGREWALLIADQFPALDHSHHYASTLPITLTDLLTRLKSESFAEVLLDLHRQHGRREY